MLVGRLLEESGSRPPGFCHHRPLVPRGIRRRAPRPDRRRPPPPGVRPGLGSGLRRRAGEPRVRAAGARRPSGAARPWSARRAPPSSPTCRSTSRAAGRTGARRLPHDRHGPRHQGTARRGREDRLHRPVHRQEGGDQGPVRAGNRGRGAHLRGAAVALRSGGDRAAARSSRAAFDGPSARLGRSIPISGGLLRAAGIDADILQNSVLVTEGKDRVLPVFHELAEGKSRARVLDVLFCEGCINGPKMTNSMSVFARKELLTDHINELNGSMAGEDMREALSEFDQVDLSREFRDEAVILPQPTEAEIAVALGKMRKFGPEDQLNCGSCGYPSCRDKAVAVCQGFAEVSMCLPYLVEELEGTLSASGRTGQARPDRTPGLHGTDFRRRGARDQQSPVHDPPVFAHAAEGAPGRGPRVGGHPDDRLRGQQVPHHHARSPGLRAAVTRGEDPDGPRPARCGSSRSP